MKMLIGEREFEVQNGRGLHHGGRHDVCDPRRQAREHRTVYVRKGVRHPDPEGRRHDEAQFKLLVDAMEFEVELKGERAPAQAKAKAKKAAGGTGAVLSQMTGRVIRVDVKPGDEVKEGDIMLVVEAMKMENEIAAPVSGTVKVVSVAAGARVAEGDPLVTIEPAAPA